MAGVINTITANNATHPLASTAFATCRTAANVVIKDVVSTNSIALVTGLTLPVLFFETNTASNIKLSVNGGNAYSVYRYGTTPPGITQDTSWRPGSLISFTFDGNAWRMNDYTIENTDTLYTAGATNNTNRLFLIGSLSQGENPQTYSNSNIYSQRIERIVNNETVYLDALYSNGKEVINTSDVQSLTNKTYQGYTLRQAASKAIDTSITSGTLSTNVPTSNAVSNFVASQIQDNISVYQNNNNSNNNYRILLSSMATDQDFSSNVLYKNSHLFYNPNELTLYINNTDTEQPVNTIFTTLQPGQILLQAGQIDQTAVDPNVNFRGSGQYNWNGIDLTANITEQQQGGSTETVSYQTTITADSAQFGGNLSSFGNFTLGNTLFSEEVGIVTIGDIESEDSIKFINNQYEGDIQTDLRGVSMGNDGILSTGDFSYWTGYNPYQIKFNNKNDQVIAENANPYNFPTSSSILNPEGLTVLSAPQGKVRAIKDQSEYYTELTDKDLKFISKTWEQVEILDEEGQPTGETELQETDIDEVVVNKQSVDAWNGLLENIGENRYTYFEQNGAGTYTLNFPNFSSYLIIITEQDTNPVDRMYLGVSNNTYGHITSITGSSTGKISNETYLTPGNQYLNGAFQFRYTGNGNLKITFINIWH